MLVPECNLPIPSKASSGCDLASVAKLVSDRLSVALCTRHLSAPGMEPVPHEETHACVMVQPLSQCAKAAGLWETAFLQVSDFDFTEDEKDDGLTMSMISSEGVKSPPNGDHVEAQAAQTGCPSKPGGSSDFSQTASLLGK